MKYKVIFVDWDGTLSNSRFWDRWNGTDKYQRIQEELFINSKDMVKDWMCGRIPYNVVLKHLEDRTVISYKELEDELRYSAEHMEYIDPNVDSLVRQLQKNGIKVVIATDNMDTFSLWTTRALKLDSLFDDALVSDSKRALKSHFHPDGKSKFFDQYLSQNTLKPKETVLIDNSEDLRVVESFGMNFLHVNEDTSLSHHLSSLLQSIR